MTSLESFGDCERDLQMMMIQILKNFEDARSEHVHEQGATNALLSDLRDDLLETLADFRVKGLDGVETHRKTRCRLSLLSARRKPGSWIS